MSDKCVHTEHCCLRHGCKYGHEDCPVALGAKPQSFDCESCDWEKNDPTHIRLRELEADKKELLVLLSAACVLSDITVNPSWMKKYQAFLGKEAT